MKIFKKNEKEIGKNKKEGLAPEFRDGDFCIAPSPCFYVNGEFFNISYEFEIEKNPIINIYGRRYNIPLPMNSDEIVDFVYAKMKTICDDWNK